MGTKQFSNYSDLLTFTRASGGHALRPCTFTETAVNGGFDTDTSWSKGTGWSIGSGVASIDGSQSAGSSLYQSKTVTAGDIIRMTVEVTAITSGTIAISYANGTGFLSASPYYATSSTGTIQRIFTVTGSGSVNFVVSGSTSAVASVDNVSIATVAFDESDGTLTLFEHPVNVPRVEWDSAGNRLGLLVEEARTNLITHSEDLADSSWNKGGSTTVTTNFTESPDKQENGVRIQMPASSGTYASRSFSATSGTEYTISLWAKDNGGEPFNFGYASTVSSGVTDGSTVTATGEWVRYSHTFTAPSTGTYYIAIDNVSNTSAVDALIFGVQLEAGSFPTSYIKTTGATATRSADVASIPVADFGYNQSEGTLFASYHAFSGQGSTTRIAALNDGSTSNSIQMALLDAGTTYHEVRSGGTAVVTTVLAGAITDDALTKTALASSLNDHAGTTNGGTVGTDTSGAMPIGITTLNIGSHYSGNFPFNGHIKSIKYYPRRLTNAQLVELTS